MIIAYIKKELIEFYNNRLILMELVRKDFNSKFLGTHLGFLWTFFQPLVFLAVLWFVFTIGFRTLPQGDSAPYFLWLSAGILPWYYMSESIQVGTSTILEYSYLIKKMSIRSEIIPFIKVLSLLTTHLFFVLVLVGIAILNGYVPSWYWIQFFYYLPAMTFLLIGINYLTSSVAVFIKDVQPIVSVTVQLLFWGTPIFWSIDHAPEKYRIFFTLNPLFYIINGYREAVIYKKWFWESPKQMLFFWLVSLCVFSVGFLIFKKLKVHFGDIL